jgi:hypothetical protein
VANEQPERHYDDGNALIMSYGNNPNVQSGQP